MTSIDTAYFGREQTAVKHRVLSRYLTVLSLIVGRSWVQDITFVDCCSGPWETATNDLSDSSIGIAFRCLKEAKEKLAAEGRSVNFRCLFVEKDATKFALLKKYCDSRTDLQAGTLHGDFVEHIPAILRFVAERKGSFPFFFIDPTGWAPLKIDPLTRLLRAEPGEVLINFMTSFVRRFLEIEGRGFEELLGSEAMIKLQGLSGQEREDAAAFAYADRIAKGGNFPHVCTTLVLHPQSDQTHYHLIYATRHPKGVEVFKQVERNASEFMALARAGAQQRRKFEVTGQNGLFGVEKYGAGSDHHLISLRQRYLEAARGAVEQELRRNKGKRIAYDNAWKLACRFPLVWETDLREWIADWRRDRISVAGMKPTQRVLRCQSGHSLVWRA